MGVGCQLLVALEHLSQLLRTTPADVGVGVVELAQEIFGTSWATHPPVDNQQKADNRTDDQEWHQEELYHKLTAGRHHGRQAMWRFEPSRSCVVGRHPDLVK